MSGASFERPCSTVDDNDDNDDDEDDDGDGSYMEKEEPHPPTPLSEQPSSYHSLSIASRVIFDVKCVMQYIDLFYYYFYIIWDQVPCLRALRQRGERVKPAAPQPPVARSTRAVLLCARRRKC